MRSWMDRQVQKAEADILHVHGLWRMPGLYAVSACKGQPCKVVWSVHGAVSLRAIAQKRLPKTLFWPVQAAALRAANCLVASSQSEYIDIRRAGFIQPICILSHGVDVPPMNRSGEGRRTLLYLGRIDELKGAHELLRAWALVENEFRDWDLEVVGPASTSVGNQLSRLVMSLGLSRVRLTGPLYGDEKWAAYQRAELFVLPSRTESFGLVVAEALAAGIPVIATKATPWARLESEGAGWSVDVGEEPLARGLRTALRLSRLELRTMGMAGREWMLREFNWSVVGSRLLAMYSWLTGQKPQRPHYVIVD